jgi:FlgD Ig-like domain
MMTLRHVFAFLMLLGIALVVGSAEANFNVWGPENGVEIRQADHIFWLHDGAAQHADGSYAVAWSAASDQSQNAYVQAYDASGNELWPTGGIQVTSDHWAQNDVIVMPFGDDEWIVGWRDYRNGTDKEHPGEFYLQRVAADGSIMWDASGVDAGSEPWHPREMFLRPGGDGFVYAAWGGFYGGFVQRFDSNGHAQYPEPLALEDQFLLNALPDDGTGLMLVMKLYDTEGIVVHHMLADGTLEWGDEGMTIVSSPGQYNPIYQATSDGLGGVFVGWSFMSSEGLNDVYGQHMDNDGIVHWENMTVIAGGDEHQTSHCMFPAGPNQFFMVWNTGEQWWYDSEIRIQRLTSAHGAPSLDWGTDVTGLPLGEDTHIQPSKCAVESDGAGGAWVAWTGDEDYNYTEDYETHLHHILNDGTTEWVEEPILTTALMCGGYTMLLQQDHVLMINREAVPFEVSIAVRSYSMTTGEQLDSQIVVEGFGEDTYEPVIERVGDSAYIGWHDFRASRQGALPFMQRVDVLTGTTMWQNDGITLIPGIDPEFDEDQIGVQNIQIVDGPSGNALAAWNMVMMGVDVYTYQIGLQMVNPQGELLWGDMGVTIERSDGLPDLDLSIGKLLPDGQGGAYLFNRVADADYAGQIFMQHIDASGNLMYADDGVELVSSDSGPYVKDVLQLSDGSFLLIFATWEVDHQDLSAMRVSTSGEELWPEPVVVIELTSPYTYIRGLTASIINDTVLVGVHASSSNYQNRIAWIQAIDADGNIAWPDDPLEFDSETYTNQALTLAPSSGNTFWVGIRDAAAFVVNRYDHNKQILTPEPLLLATIDPRFGYPNMVADDAGGVFVAWQCGQDWQDTNLRYTHINIDGEYAQPEYDAEGLFLTDAVYQQEQLHVVSDNEGGFLAAWNDYRGRVGALEGDDVYAMRINETVSGVNPAPVAQLPKWELYPVYPNPFNPSTQVMFTLAAHTDVRIDVYDVLGRRVTTLVNDALTAGTHTTNWDGLDRSGSPSASGVYFVRMETPQTVKTQKAILMK